MTEYDYSEEGYRRFQETQHRIANWADDTDHCAHQFKSPFVPRSDVASNAFYNPQGQRPPPPPARQPQRSYSQGYTQSPSAVPTPQRSNTNGYALVSPRDSVSQAGITSSSSRRHHSASHSPSRHGSGHRSSHSSHRRSSMGTYVVQGSVPMQYIPQPQLLPQVQPAAYVVVPRGKRVQIVYPEPQYTTQYTTAPAPEHHSFLQRIFGSQSGKSHHGRSRSVSHSRSTSRSRR